MKVSISDSVFDVGSAAITGVGSGITSIPQSGVTNLTSDLALKAALASPALTGTPTAPTAAALTNTTQIATTAFAAGEIAAAFHPGFVSDLVYGPIGEANTTVNNIVDCLWMTPIYIPVSSTWDGIFCNITTNVNPSTIRLGVYNTSASTKTATTVVTNAEVTVSGATTGEKIGTTTAFTLNVGWYFLAAWCHEAVAFRASTTNSHNHWLYGHAENDMPTSFTGFYQLSVSAGSGLPSTPTVSKNSGGATPYIGIRKV